jgi:hypothetical protein
MEVSSRRVSSTHAWKGRLSRISEMSSSAEVGGCGVTTRLLDIVATVSSTLRSRSGRFTPKGNAYKLCQLSNCGVDGAAVAQHKSWPSKATAEGCRSYNPSVFASLPVLLGT